MKRFFTLFFCLITTLAFSQIIYTNDFEAGLGDMTIVDNDGLTAAANVSAFQAAWTVSNETFGNGTNMAISNSWYSPAGQADDWLISPQISISGPCNVISWDARAIDPSFPDGYQVLVSTSGNAIADFTDVIFEVDREATTIQNRLTSLAAYDGKDIYFAFRNNSTDQFLLVVDNVTVEALVPYNVSFSSDDLWRYREVGADIELSGTLFNGGCETITSVDFTWNDGTNNNVETISGLNLTPGLDTVLIHPVFASTAVTDSELVIDINVSNPNGNVDSDASDNAGQFSFRGVIDPPAKQMYLEESTGTWCPWCPRGAVFMDKMKEDYPDNIAGISIHVGNSAANWPDPMQYDGTDSYAISYANLFGGIPFPSLVVDRFVDPGIPALSDVDGDGVGEMDEFGVILVDFTNARTSPVGVSVEGVIDGAARTLTADLTISAHSTLSATNYNVNVLVTEDDVTGPSGSGAGNRQYDQANNYAGGGVEPMEGYESLPNPVPGADMVYNHTLRADLAGSFTGENGVIPANIAPGETYTKTYTYTVPADYDINNLNLVAVVYDMNDSGVAFNANINRNLTLNTSLKDELLEEGVVKVYPNPFSERTNIEVNLTEASEVRIAVLDAVGKVVAEKNYGELIGKQTLPFYATSLSNGIYFIHVTVNDKISTRRVSVAR